MNVEATVLERYSEGAIAPQAALCCPVDYDSDLLNLLPPEVIEKDYGCGDPSRYVQAGDTVLDLGSGSGKIAYMAAHLVGSEGAVIGVDMNDDMLALAQKYQAEMAHKLGGDRVRFVKGYIQDLALDLAATDAWLNDHPVRNSRDQAALIAWQELQRIERPLIHDDSVDLVVSNCVLNLVRDSDKEQLLQEIFRVVKPGGRVAISDIVCDVQVPAHLKADHDLWSGCISGAMEESEFLQAFVDVGFLTVKLDQWSDEPWQVVEGLAFRAVTVTAIKPHEADALTSDQEVIYRGPYAQVQDEAGNVYPRGVRIKVSQSWFDTLQSSACAGDFIAISGSPSAPAKSCCAPPAGSQEVAHNEPAKASGCCG